MPRPCGVTSEGYNVSESTTLRGRVHLGFQFGLALAPRRTRFRERDTVRRWPCAHAATSSRLRCGFVVTSPAPANAVLPEPEAAVSDFPRGPPPSVSRLTCCVCSMTGRGGRRARAGVGRASGALAGGGPVLPVLTRWTREALKGAEGLSGARAIPFPGPKDREAPRPPSAVREPGGRASMSRALSVSQGRGLGCGRVASLFLCAVTVLGRGRCLVASVFMWDFMEFCSRLLKMPLREETLLEKTVASTTDLMGKEGAHVA